MANHDYVIANQTGANTRSDLNNLFQAIVSQNSSSSEPATKYAYMLWADTTSGVLKVRNSANNAWLSVYSLTTGANTGSLPLAGGTMTGNIVMGTNLVDGIDISARDAVLTSTTTTANAAMPKAGGAFTGNITTTGLIDTRDVAADGVTADAALPKAGGTITGTVTVSANAVGTVTTDNDGSFAMSATNNFKCTPAGDFALTFTSIVAQSGNILFINSGGHTISAHANTKVDANLLATISTAGTYLLAYFSDGTNVYMTNSAVYT